MPKPEVPKAGVAVCPKTDPRAGVGAAGGFSGSAAMVVSAVAGFEGSTGGVTGEPKADVAVMPGYEGDVAFDTYQA